MNNNLVGATKITGIDIDTELCAGCGNCVVACPLGIDVLVVIDGKARVVGLEKCYRLYSTKEDCNECIEACPTKAIKFKEECRRS